jgi:hypothetical protein
MKLVYLAALVAGAATGAQAQALDADPSVRYGRGTHETTGTFSEQKSLRTRCVAEERSGRHLSSTCAQYKADLNRLLRRQARK